ncbi:YpdA family putative bacillithiol disulfide reductase [Aquibacillus sp. 3ASR75-11]|uniref:YpdA family putative bacillithiol disulfide reductase n=1 Tax=Terrihalobacillus insolitus TaxID=2950438 RepID=A0A9X3WS35_9BACI|nr:YpdA family putative bacillithiol disulfide reductase [Terrihalobacillus insolitus]MDC3413075.1 YpdA family putative bacillithiol disulfide reductase [Terrihalobacillus insolitus]MDC3424817.1 YpdA family putative bacillithiol disulfide reductase [Terrihalobacillus insolitus]
MQVEDTIIIGGGPCGMSVAIELQKKGQHPLIIEKENVVNTIYRFPTHQSFFSSSDKLEIGEVPFITENQKPVRSQALAYYRSVASLKNLRINTYERVTKIEKLVEEDYFVIHTMQSSNHQTYRTRKVVVATGYYDLPNTIGVTGEELDKVMHYFKEAHPYFNKNVVVIGGKNSAVDATLELHKVGAHVTVLYRGSEYSSSIKPWILPEFDSLIRKGKVEMVFNANVHSINKETVVYEVNGRKKEIVNDFVFAMTGYRPDLKLLLNTGVEVDENTGKPVIQSDTMETNIAGVYIAGVVASGFNNNEIFIENGRFHGEKIARHICRNSE